MKSWSSVYLPPIDSRFIFPALCLRNTSSQSVEALPIKEVYRMYVCGITPYDATHLGHAATYVTFDLINRYLRAMGMRVLYVQNVTDVDDPLLERAARDGVDWQDLALSQIDLFRGDMNDLHVIPPQDYIGAVESIPLVIEAIRSLQEKGTVYAVDKDLYFSVRSDKRFGEISHFSQEEMLSLFAERGGDPLREGKRDQLDALLWLSHRASDPSWPSLFGEGRPGWHIECCAIALNYLHPDSQEDFAIDIQGGGRDLIFPHHEMGAAQAAGIYGKEFARVYVHAGMIGLNGEKMSKSLGNLVFLSTLVRSGIDPMAIRLTLISDHYLDDRMWSDTRLSEAIAFLDRLRNALSRPEVAPTSNVIQSMIKSLSRDLDTPAVLGALRSWCEETESGADGGSAGELSRAIDLLLGIAI